MKTESNFQGFLDILDEPAIVLNKKLQVTQFNDRFLSQFVLSRKEVEFSSFYELGEGQWKIPALEELLEEILPYKRQVKGYEVPLGGSGREQKIYVISAAQMRFDDAPHFLLKFQEKSRGLPRSEKGSDYVRDLSNILHSAPAMICTLKGPQHVFELVNQKYLQLLDKGDVLGKPVKEVIPEAEDQGFLELLDQVYTTGKPFEGKEVPILLKNNTADSKQLFLNFVYQPTFDEAGDVDGIFVHVVDVTEQVLTRKEIEKNQAQLKIILDTVPAIIWMTDKNGKTTFLSKNWFDYTGVEIGEINRTGWLHLIHPEEQEVLSKHFEAAVTKKIAYSLTYRMKFKDGSYRWVLGNGRPKFLSSGEFDGLIGTLVDVNEEKEKEQVIREKEHRIRSIVDEATVATAVYVGPEMKIELANDAMIKLWGKDRSVIGKKLKDALPELEGQPFQQLLDEVYSSGETYVGREDRVDLVIDNELRTGYFNFSYKPLRNSEGQINGILNMAMDVTEIVTSKNLLKQSESHFRQMADLMPEKVSNTDPLGNYVYFNQNWLDYTGKTSDELKKEGWAVYVHPEEQEDYLNEWSRCLTTGEDFEMELRLRDKQGKYIWHLNRAEAITAEDGSIKMWIGTNTEVQRLKEEEKRKEDFLKMVSHELKTPVTSIKGYVQLLLNITQRSKDDQLMGLPFKPSLERIDHQIVRLTRLISEMLDLSRLEENKLELQKEQFSLNDLVDQTVQDINYTNTQHSIIVCHEYNCEVIADKDRIGQVLINFITNAIKYSPQSQNVQVRIHKAAPEEVEVCVVDKGIGIHSANQKNIFRRFYRVETNENDETYSGFGIGLYLAKEIIERHKGSINVKSQLGEGSEFSFRLSIAEEKPPLDN